MHNAFSNPWENMKTGSQRRVDYETNYDYFWVRDYDDRYGLTVKLDFETKELTTISLKGIELKRFESNGGQTKFHLFLDSRDDWELFNLLCYDLITVMDVHVSDIIKANKLLERLEQWKDLLANDSKLRINKEQQMGLFSELYCLKELLSPELGYSVATDAWVGMEKDKQDFNLAKSALEVKSHITTKGNVATISSMNQLYSRKDKLFLVSYGLTINENGQSIDELFDSVIIEMTQNQREILMTKVFQYGWIPHHTKLEKISFLVDSEEIYEVTDDFPKIDIESVDYRIVEVSYKINLSKCDKFKREAIDIFEVI